LFFLYGSLVKAVIEIGIQIIKVRNLKNNVCCVEEITIILKGRIPEALLIDKHGYPFLDQCGRL
jgi:hypothetical protein